MLRANRGRVAGQSGVAAQTVAKLALTGEALGVTAYSGVVGSRLRAADGVVFEGGIPPAVTTPPDVARIQKQLGASGSSRP